MNCGGSIDQCPLYDFVLTSQPVPSMSWIVCKMGGNVFYMKKNQKVPCMYQQLFYDL